MGTQADPIWLLEIMLQWTRVSKYLFYDPDFISFKLPASGVAIQ